MYRDRCNERDVYWIPSDLKSCENCEESAGQGNAVKFAPIIQFPAGLSGGEKSMFPRIWHNKL